MKYMLTWNERPQGSPIEYENAQKRILEVFTQWKAPSNFKIELFVIRVGDWGVATWADMLQALPIPFRSKRYLANRAPKRPRSDPRDAPKSGPSSAGRSKVPLGH
jgi:hypothetical protein